MLTIRFFFKKYIEDDQEIWPDCFKWGRRSFDDVFVDEKTQNRVIVMSVIKRNPLVIHNKVK